MDSAEHRTEEPTTRTRARSFPPLLSGEDDLFFPR